VAVRSKASGKRAAAATHLAMGWLVTLSVPMLVLIQSWSLCAAQLTSRQMATLEVLGGRGNQTPTVSPEATAIGW